MKRFTGFAVLVMSLTVLSSCGGAGVSDAKINGGEVTIETFSNSLYEPDETKAPAETIGEISFEEPAAEPEEENAPPEESFEFPPEFFEEMAEIVKNYGLNEGCDDTDECLCEPERETVAEDGTVTEPRAKTMSVYFCDLESGYEYMLNPGAHYPVASTVKIPFCTYIYQKIDAGEIDPEQVLTYEQRHYFGGTGVIVEGDFGQQFTVSELLTLAITRSDNVAYEMLKDIVSLDELSEFLIEKGCDHETDVRTSKQKICCRSAGVYGKIMAEYLRSDGASVEKFKEDLLNTRLKMIVADSPVYRKYGWAGYSFHDIAYVDAKRPYVLAILTNLENEGNSDLVLFRDVSKLIERYSQGDKNYKREECKWRGEIFMVSFTIAMP